MSIILGLLIYVAWVVAIETCIESRRAKNIGHLTVLICCFWVMQAALKQQECSSSTYTPSRAGGFLLPW